MSFDNKANDNVVTPEYVSPFPTDQATAWNGGLRGYFTPGLVRPVGHASHGRRPVVITIFQQIGGYAPISNRWLRPHFKSVATPQFLYYLRR